MNKQEKQIEELERELKIDAHAEVSIKMHIEGLKQGYANAQVEVVRKLEELRETVNLDTAYVDMDFDRILNDIFKKELASLNTPLKEVKK